MGYITARQEPGQRAVIFVSKLFRAYGLYNLSLLAFVSGFSFIGFKALSSLWVI